MSKKKLVMEFAGLNVNSTCMKCGYLNPQYKDMYRCCCKGSCPHYLTQDQKDELIASWNPVEIEVPTFEEQMDAQYSNMATDICKMEDERILREMVGGIDSTNPFTKASIKILPMSDGELAKLFTEIENEPEDPFFRSVAEGFIGNNDNT